MRKIIKAMLITSMFASIAASPVMAGQWKTGAGENAAKWWYVNDDNSYAANGWKQINNVWYYFDQNGWMLANTRTPDGYLVGVDGSWVQNVVKTSSTETSSNSTENTGTVTSGKSYYHNNYDKTNTSDEVTDINSVTQDILNQFAREIVDYTNQDRAKAGLSSVKIDDELMDYAMIRAKESSQLFAHKHPDGSSLSKKYKENLQYHKSPSFSSEDAETAWMNSTGHRKNILTATHTHIGVGVYVENDTVYCAQVFENKNSSSSSTSSMSDEEFQSWAKSESGLTDEEIAAGNIKFYRPGEGTFKVNYND